MFEFNFTTRDEYLQQKKAWLFVYKDRVKKIRQAKQDIKHAQRTKFNCWTELRALSALRIEMEKLIKLRRSAREEAGRQYSAQKEQA
jgi:hypothetical protein